VVLFVVLEIVPKIVPKLSCVRMGLSNNQRTKAAAYNPHFSWIYFSALAEFDQNAQITILPTLQWADLFFAPGSIYFFTCVGIPSDPYDALTSPHNKHKRETMLKRPPIAGGKISLASQRKKSSQLLESEQQQRDCADLLLLVGRNSSLAALVAPGTPSGRDERYDACVAQEAELIFGKWHAKDTTGRTK
jgi:hypothetical protein